MRFIVVTKKLLLRILAVALFIFLAAAFIFIIRAKPEKTAMVMGAVLLKSEKEEETNKREEVIVKDWNEYYFRPSKLTALNTNEKMREVTNKYYDKKSSEIKLPKELMKSPQDAVINYFSILREAHNMIEGKYGGCGTVGDSQAPYPIAYNFLSTDYKNKISYQAFLDSFKGIAHINLIKLNNITDENTEKGMVKYFIELETLEPSGKDSTYFAYYFGYMYLVNEGGQFKVSNVELYGEDFLCAPYHGWRHDAEAYVDITYGGWCKLIKKRYPTVQEGYVKDIVIDGTDGKQYKFKFFHLTNGVDIEVQQFVNDGNNKWKTIKIDPEDCLQKNKIAEE